jgi:hypothetical protein
MSNKGKNRLNLSEIRMHANMRMCCCCCYSLLDKITNYIISFIKSILSWYLLIKALPLRSN